MPTVRLYYGEGLKQFHIVECSKATKKVELSRTEKDVLSGKRGLPRDCADANCAMRLKSRFAHPVYLAYFVGKRAYIVDEVEDGIPVHCVRYHHDDKSIPEFDKPGGPESLIKSGKAKATIHLVPPPPSAVKDYSSPKAKGSSHQRTDGSRTPKIPRGVRRRAEASGINFGKV